MTADEAKTPEVAATERRPTYGTRIDDYGAFATRSAWVAGGVVALIALAAGDVGAHLFAHGPKWLLAAVLTLALAAGACAAFARVQFQWAATRLERRVEQEQIERNTPTDEPWETTPDYLLRAALILTAAAGITFVALLWVEAFGLFAPDECD